MMNMHLNNRSGLAAIAVATALISTPGFAQEAAPVVAEPAPIVADEPLPAEPAPVVSDTLAPDATPAAPVTRTARPTRATNAPAARAPAAVQRREIAPAAAAVAPEAPTTPVAQAPTSVDPAMVAPLPEPVAANPAPAAPISAVSDDLLPIAGAAGLGLLAIAGAGYAFSRRRRTEDTDVIEETWHEPAMSRLAPVVETEPTMAQKPVAAAPVAASAFSWGNAPKSEDTSATRISRIEAAKRGPTPDNPSLSLKKRLKRAAFFDQRDRQVAAGVGTPVSDSAGLPDAMTPATVKEPVSRRPERPMSMSFGKTFQPA